ncbi:hypothetical protein EVAR_93322_1 [Eumeta japonica]|uniref:Uncharacterized protein n=1 Tax=Eumeta variegata TaxID=151549 RepID=A0A4C1USW2_EUMVA|nr:hypothetical protein EVAR_93322_1 [Eumeta japonica]
MNLDNLDKALHDLGMLSAITEARREYLRETKSSCGVMRFNTRYVSNVTVGYCMKRTTTKNRLCPYLLPIRHRTKSENSDSVCNSDKIESGHESHVNNLFEPSTSNLGNETYDNNVSFILKSPTKRCQSLENLNLLVDSRSQPESIPDMDCVSTRIQKLQVDE